MLNQLRHIIIHFLIKRKIGQTKLSGKDVSFHSAKKVGIIAVMDSKDRMEQVINFKKRIESYGPKVVSIGYVPLAIIPDYFNTQMQTDVFSKKDVNFFGIPGNSFVKEFLNEEFDILIDLTLDEVLPLIYVAGLSKARLKAGKYRANMLHVYDFLLKADEGKPFGDFLFSMKNYLSIINSSTP